MQISRLRDFTRSYGKTSFGYRDGALLSHPNDIRVGVYATDYISNYMSTLDLTPGFNGLGRDNFETRRDMIKCWDLMRLILEV